MWYLFIHFSALVPSKRIIIWMAYDSLWFVMWVAVWCYHGSACMSVRPFVSPSVCCSVAKFFYHFVSNTKKTLQSNRPENANKFEIAKMKNLQNWTFNWVFGTILPMTRGSVHKTLHCLVIQCLMRLKLRAAHFCMIKLIKTENYLGQSAVCKIRLGLTRAYGHVHILRICTAGNSGDYIAHRSFLYFNFHSSGWRLNCLTLEL